MKNPLKILVNCHCSMCRKTIGAAVGSYFLLPRDDLVLVESSTLTGYISSAHGVRHFCNRCGCSAYLEDSNAPHLYVLPSGTLDGDPGIQLAGESNVKYKVPWQQLVEGVPNSEEDDMYPELAKRI